MPKGKLLTDLIAAYAERDMSKRETACHINRSQNVVIYFLKNPGNYGKKHAGEWVPTVTNREKRLLLMDLTNKSMSIREAKRVNRLTASVTIIWRSIKVSPNIKFQKMKITSETSFIYLNF